jgi:hypothetical protein
MFQNIDIKLVFSVVASVIAIVAYYPYIRDIFLRKTKPHMYTWLIWAITTGTATAGAWRGEGGGSVFSLAIILAIVLVIVLLSLKYGTKNITKSDKIILILALGSIVVWWQLDNPTMAVIMAAVIDVFAYIPTYRKSWNFPGEETLVFWMADVIIYTLILLSLAEYNWLTVPYIVVSVVANIILVVILFFRKRIVNKLN